MAYTDTGSTNAGRIYDSSEIFRLDDLLSTQDELFGEAEAIDTQRKDLIRYFVIGGGAILILVFLRLAIKNK
jgi:hypothetical protein